MNTAMKKIDAIAKKIGVSVNLPTTPEGIERLKAQMIIFNSEVLGGALGRVDAPLKDKQAYVRSLHGVVPWAKGGTQT